MFLIMTSGGGGTKNSSTLPLTGEGNSKLDLDVPRRAVWVA
jgi:hypothetical protein